MRKANELTGFYMVRAFAERFFRISYLKRRKLCKKKLVRKKKVPNLFVRI